MSETVADQSIELGGGGGGGGGGRGSIEVKTSLY